MSADECNILDSIFQTFNLNRNGTSCCNWRKVECSSGRVTALDLSGNQLSGSIPAELGKLPNLRYLYLENNQLSGSIPADLGKLSNLRELHLYNNQLSGPIASLPNVSTNCSIITSASSNSNSKLCLAPSFNKTGKCFDNLKQFSIPDCPVPIFPGPTAPPEPLATTSGLPLAAVFGIIAAVFVVTLIVFVGCFWCRRSVSQPSNNMESPANSAATMVDLSLTKPEAAMPGLQKSVESMLPSQGLVDLQPVNQSLSKDHNAIVPAGSQVRSAGVAGDETLYLGDAPGRVVKKDNDSDVLYIA